MFSFFKKRHNSCYEMKHAVTHLKVNTLNKQIIECRVQTFI
jgi:hypothetical protein